MELLSKAANAPVDFNCHRTNLKLFGLRLMDWGVIEQWMRSQIVAAAVQVIKDSPDLSPDLRGDILRAAHAESTKVSVGQCFLSSGQVTEDIGKTMAYLRTFEGMMRVVHLSMRDEAGEKGKPLHKLEHVGELFQNDNNTLIEAFGIVVDISFPTVEDTGGVNEESKNPEPKKTKTQ